MDEGLDPVFVAAGRDQPPQALLAVTFTQHGGKLRPDHGGFAVPAQEVDQPVLEETDIDFAL